MINTNLSKQKGGNSQALLEIIFGILTIAVPLLFYSWLMSRKKSESNDDKNK
ncbi:hypothetical protein CPAV1605_242 [seawater metagenome]|uniref:Uncharacterized protein n=1 Tax=seawater metagenome TaxID=1561972 RepID=A0A5E8CHJ2_9ZZZZ